MGYGARLFAGHGGLRCPSVCRARWVTVPVCLQGTVGYGARLFAGHGGLRRPSVCRARWVTVPVCLWGTVGYGARLFAGHGGLRCPSVCRARWVTVPVCLQSTVSYGARLFAGHGGGGDQHRRAVSPDTGPAPLRRPVPQYDLQDTARLQGDVPHLVPEYVPHVVPPVCTSSERNANRTQDLRVHFQKP